MSLEIFERELRKECRVLFVDLKNGKRKNRLLIKSNNTNSMSDVINRGKEIDAAKLHRSCVITFGNVLEKATTNYAEVMHCTVYRNKNFLSAKIDIVFRIIKRIYNLESKSNIELDAGKSKKALETLKRKHKLVFHGLDCANAGFQVISKFVVWTKPTSKSAALFAKKPIEEIHLMGFKEFFNLFNINIEENDFFNMLQKVFQEEVEAFF